MEIDELRRRIGVTESVAVKMLAVDATILREDGRLFRACACRVRHPVGDLHRGYVPARDLDAHLQASCCERRCCQVWLGKVEAAVASNDGIATA